MVSPIPLYIRMARLIPVIVAVDKDFVVPINYTAANLDDGEGVSNCNINSDRLHANGDSMSDSYFQSIRSLTVL
jgi:hypothetical protein